MLGFSKKQPKKKVEKKVAPKPTAPPVTELLKKEFGINEGPAYEYGKEWSKVEKTYKDFWDAVIELGKYNTKKTGDKTDEKIFIKQYNKNVGKFYELMKSWLRTKM